MPRHQFLVLTKLESTCRRQQFGTELARRGGETVIEFQLPVQTSLRQSSSCRRSSNKQHRQHRLTGTGSSQLTTDHDDWAPKKTKVSSFLGPQT